MWRPRGRWWTRCEAVRAAAPDLPCEVEVDSLEQLDAVSPSPELVLLDNFPVWQTQMAVQRRDAGAPRRSARVVRRAHLWRTRRPTPRRVWITWPSLTHSVRVLDIGLDM